MAEKDLTMEDDWGTKGAQATGAQVQKFLKDQIKSLHDKDATLQNQIDSINIAQDEINPQLRAVTDGCFVAFTENSSGNQCAVPWWEWPAKESHGEVANGVLVLIDGQVPIIVAPTFTQLPWSKNAIAVDPNLGGVFEKAYKDFTGQTRTAAIMAKGVELFGEVEVVWNTYAPAWCDSYARRHDNTHGSMVGISAGHWWLPSTAELVSIWKHRYAINQCLSVISGASKLPEGLYWSSTEYSATLAWGLAFPTGPLRWQSKVGIYGYVRPVTAFT